MTNKLTQAELIHIAEQSGVNYSGEIESTGITFSSASLAKFAQLIQQAVVPQALEKAAQYVDGMVSDEDGRVILTKSTISVGIRALIDQPVDHIEESLGMVEQGGDELVEACEELISQYEAVPEFTMGGKLTSGPFIKIREALANRRGGE